MSKKIIKMANFSALLTITLLLCSTLMCTARPDPTFSTSITIVTADPLIIKKVMAVTIVI
ncbi:hypothetical protein HID58_015391 [Brassica napus]|uniref:Uncharacterized protein n=1 Tax=Brassica napus TaxID=3708 RepID=A0ABQ8DJY5_BRANA|nr:hypothetical protein HID58_015391 [Brassica napus]